MAYDHCSTCPNKDNCKEIIGYKQCPRLMICFYCNKKLCYSERGFCKFEGHYNGQKENTVVCVKCHNNNKI